MRSTRPALLADGYLVKWGAPYLEVLPVEWLVDLNQSFCRIIPQDTLHQTSSVFSCRLHLYATHIDSDNLLSLGKPLNASPNQLQSPQVDRTPHHDFFAQKPRFVFVGELGK
jgi:hypothetical protein